MKRSWFQSKSNLFKKGWEKYAKEWRPDKFPVLPGHRVQYLGDEWTAEEARVGVIPYGLSPEVVAHFNDHINQNLLTPNLPAEATEGLEIGSGGGRFTALLLPRTKVLHVADASKAMLQHLKQRFVGNSKLRYYLTDGMTLPALQPASLDYVFAFDVFVHFEPRLIYWYLQQIGCLLKPGGIGIIHYPNILTPSGWRVFEIDLTANVLARTSSGAFGVMSPELMSRFLEVVGLEIISPDTRLIPRDAVAVFRKPVENKK